MTTVVLKITVSSDGDIQPPEEMVTLREALEALDLGNYGKARQIAMRLQYQVGPGQLGGPAFVLGAAAAYEADTLWGKNKLTQHALAAQHLEESRDRGFPEDREGEGLFLLGRSLYRSNQVATSRSVLAHALKIESASIGPQQRLIILRMLAEAHLTERDSDLQEALKFSQEYLNTTNLSDEDRDDGLLRHARILFKLDNLESCRTHLDQLSADAHNRADAMVMRGRLLMRVAERLPQGEEQSEKTSPKAAELYQAAMSVFQKVQEHYSAGEAARSRAHYLTGLCLKRLGQPNEAITELRKVRNLSADSEEGVVAALAEGDLLLELGKDDVAIRRYRDAVTAIVATGTLNNPWVSLNEMRQRLLGVVGNYISANKFEQAVQMAELVSPIVRTSQSVQLKAEAQVEWAKALAAQSESAPRDEQQLLQSDARKHYREAGQIHARLARLRFASRDYPDDLWNSAESFRLGHDYANAIKIFDEYLKNESRRRIPAALVGLGESHLALGNYDKAIEALTTCIEDHPQDASVYRARILAAEAHTEKGEIDLAETFLQSNLSDRHLGPKSHEWQESLFALGKILHKGGRYSKAIPKLEEAVRRYPKSPHAMEARYLIAESYREAAQDPLRKFKEATIEANRQQYIAELRKLLTESESYYESVRQDLNLRPDTVTLTPLEAAILRNCYFALGAVYFTQGAHNDEYYERAIRAYSDATNLYQNSPEVLEALVQIAACHRRLNEPAEARGKLEQARVILNQLDSSLDFERTTNFTKQEWKKYLQDLIDISK